MKIRIWKEWYDILLKIALMKRKSFEETLKDILKSDECLNLPKTPTTKIKELNVMLYELSPKEVEDKIKKFLFCE